MAGLGLRICRRMLTNCFFWYFLAIFFFKVIQGQIQPHFQQYEATLQLFKKSLTFVKDFKLAPGCLEACVNCVLKLKILLNKVFSKVQANLRLTDTGIKYNGILCLLCTTLHCTG